jgi:two-component system, NarL family, response regulator DesR
MIRVLLVRDSGEAGAPRSCLQLSRQADIHVVGTLPFGPDLPDRAAALLPRVVVIDTEYMVSQILPVASRLRTRLPSCSVLVLSDPSKRGMLPPRRWARELSFLVKNASDLLIADSVRRLAAGERIVHPRLQAASLNTEREFSTRELEVLGLAAEGETVADIAGRLYLSGGTVRNYLSTVITKAGATPFGSPGRTVGCAE